MWASAWAINFVKHNDGLEAASEGFHGHEAGLWHWAINRVNQEADRIDHRQYAFNLATEVGVAWSVDDVDAVFLAIARVSPFDGSVFCQNGNAAFLLQIVGVHDALDITAAIAEGARLL